ncbi:MAG: hypothetical protein IJ523_03970 [Succinivibrionaceae bacterium]|nr:hypothetical protein [Succinivibrionaceae bacterium]
MHFQFLVEDVSSAVLIKKVMDTIIGKHIKNTYNCKSFKGIGHFIKKNTAKETRTGKLLNDLATYMRGFQRSLQGISASLIVVLDNDDKDPQEFQKSLQNIAKTNSINMDYVFCIAVEEVEAWLLGDEAAIRKAYPDYKKKILHDYKQDSICGTWELLADVVYKGGMQEIQKRKMSYMEIGKLKSEWADKISDQMTFEVNKSPSFQNFYKAICNRVE